MDNLPLADDITTSSQNATRKLLIPKSELMPRSQPMSSYLLYSSLVFHHSQVPCPAMISVTPMLGRDANHFHKPSNIFKGGNEAATFDLLAPGILTTGSRVYWEDCSPSTVPHSILIFSTNPLLFQHPWPSPSPFYLTVNTQTQTYTQIHTHAQIPAYVQLPALFQPHVLSQPSAHLCCNQAPCLAMISTGPLLSAKTPLITHRLCIISVDGNRVATVRFA